MKLDGVGSRFCAALRQSPDIGLATGPWEILTGLFAGGIVLVARPLSACKALYCGQASAMRRVAGTRIAGVCGKSAAVLG
jgi:hypothetical protein